MDWSKSKGASKYASRSAWRIRLTYRLGNYPSFKNRLCAWISILATLTMIDISQILIRSASQEQEVTVLKSIFKKLLRRFPSSRIDWDSGDGEEWARCILGKECVAYVRAKSGVFIVVPVKNFDDQFGKNFNVEIVVVPSMGDSCLRAESSVVVAFAGREVSDNIDYDSFCADDLYWATV